MSRPAIVVDSLGKFYRIGLEAERFPTFRAMLADMLRAPLRRFGRLRAGTARDDDVFWALRDVSFQVEDGEVLGIIGRNGAGKSTLLKILSRITDPSEGTARLRGHVGSLLEVGTGFHPELTGRENIFLNGAILGMARSEIASKFDEIVAFAEVERFLDTPVKRYSSGMYVRLAFAVAAHLDPEILLVDEVLAVGDAGFQKKCLGRMTNVAKAGRTILFVSHNMLAIQSLCQRVLWLEDGAIREIGPPSRVVSNYLASARESASERLWEDRETAPGNDAVRLHSAFVRPALRSGSAQIATGTPVDVSFEFWNLVPGARLNLSVYVYSRDGALAFNTGPVREKDWNGKALPRGLFRSGFRIPGDLLNDGPHSLTLLVVEDQSRIIYQHEEILVFNVNEEGADRGAWHGNWIGAVRPILDWQTKLLEEL